VIDESQIILAQDWIGQCSLVGWFASEKLNGCRAYWDGKSFWTRAGNKIRVPRSFTRNLPDMHLDGEIHAGRGIGFGNENSAYKIAMRAVVHGEKWLTPDITFTAFDAPQVKGSWLERTSTVPGRFRLQWQAIKSPFGLVNYMANLRKLGAEGACFRNPNETKYSAGRTGNLLRWKFEK
jgi:DNA ligase-1